MYVAMNRFHVNAGREEVFEEIWRNRDSYLDQVPGFKEFHLLRGETREGIMGRTFQPELDRDPERKGVAVLIRVDKVGGSTAQQRER